MREKINSETLSAQCIDTPTLHGKAIIQLFDAEGKETAHIEEENLVTNAVKNMLNSGLPQLLNNAYMSDIVTRIAPIYDKCYHGLLLFDENIEEDADRINIPDGVNCLGHAGRNYAETDPLRGTYNENESGEIAKGWRHVWDFGTDKANGVIKCLALTSPNAGDYGVINNTWYGINQHIASQSNKSFLFQTSYMAIPGVNNITTAPLRYGMWLSDYKMLDICLDGDNPYALVYRNNNSISPKLNDIVKIDLSEVMGNKVSLKMLKSGSNTELINTSTTGALTIYAGAAYQSLLSGLPYCANVYKYDEKYHVVAMTTSTNLYHAVYSVSFQKESEVNITLDTPCSYNSASYLPFFFEGEYFANLPQTYSNGAYYYFNVRFNANGVLQETYTTSYPCYSVTASSDSSELRMVYSYSSGSYVYYVQISASSKFENYKYILLNAQSGVPKLFDCVKSPLIVASSIYTNSNYGGSSDSKSVEYFCYYSSGIIINLISNPVYLGTINNLATPITKTNAQTMKITYELTSAAEDKPNFPYAVNADGETATVTGYMGKGTTITIPSEIDDYDITTIGGLFAYLHYSVKTVIVPNGVTYIGDNAFYGCNQLTEINMPNGVNYIGNGAFYNCLKLAQISIPDGVTYIGDEAFYNCYHLTELIVPDSVVYLGANALYQCYGIQNLTIGNGVAFAITQAFINSIGTQPTTLQTVTFGDGIPEIGEKAFYQRTQLQSFSVGNGCEAIGAQAFYGCSNLSAVSIGIACETIGDYAFYGCSLLTSLDLPEGLTSIGAYAFRNCGFTQIVLPSSVTEIGDGAFYSCGITTIIVPANANNNDGAFRYVYSLATVTLSAGLTTVGNNMFYSCSTLTEIDIPNSVTSIGSYAFYSCSNLIEVTIGNGITTIGNNAFYYCSALSTVNYNGTKSEWALITKGGDWRYHANFSIVHCIDGDTNA